MLSPSFGHYGVTTAVTAFTDFSSDDLSRLAKQGNVRSFPKHSVLMNEGDQSDSLHIILEGRIKVFVSDERGKQITLRIQGPNEMFGELALIDEAPRSASVMTLQPSRIAVISKDDLLRFLASDPGFAFKLLKRLVQHVRMLTDNVKSLALLDVYGRVARTLLTLGTEESGTLVIKERLTHQELADMVGASREMVSKIMKDLARGGYIENHGSQLMIRGKLPRGW